MQSTSNATAAMDLRSLKTRWRQQNNKHHHESLRATGLKSVRLLPHDVLYDTSLALGEVQR